ncbi:hypothetical protein R3P38DRAFT_3238211 [Favolaschia claudopus]|uniref:Uncharacterized protein n=1 Tax=Favolaschia claudopus TaxID=2862362 RepID=A0AAV9ZA28_9AGAR
MATSLEIPTTQATVQLLESVVASQQVDFVLGYLFATGCAAPITVPVPVNVVGTGNAWNGLYPSQWLSPTFAMAPAPFNYTANGRLVKLFEGEHMSSPLLVLFTDQDLHPAPGVVVHPNNKLVTEILGDLPLQWTGNVLVLRVKSPGRLENISTGDLTYVKGALRS